jgi:ribosome maturation factor RimP
MHEDNSDQSSVTLADCEKVTHQLLHVLRVEDIAYERLEVSSPGLDRPLRKFTDYVRFCGKEAVVKFHTPVQAFTNQKSFQGILLGHDGEKLKIECETKDGGIVLDFVLSDVEKAYLVPQVNFRSHKR